MAEAISNEDIQSTLNYISSIKANYKLSVQYVMSLNNLLWAFLFFSSGLIDYLFAVLNFDFGSILVWFMSSIFGALYTSLQVSHLPSSPENEKEKIQITKIYNTLRILIILSWVGFLWVGFAGYAEYIMVLVPLMIGLIFVLIFVKNAARPNDTIFSIIKKIPKNTGVIHPMTMSFLASIVNLLGLLFIGISYTDISGLMMGLIVGFGFLVRGIKLYREYHKN